MKVAPTLTLLVVLVALTGCSGQAATHRLGFTPVSGLHGHGSSTTTPRAKSDRQVRLPIQIVTAKDDLLPPPDITGSAASQDGNAGTSP